MATTGLSHLVFSVWFVWDCVHQFNEEFAEYRGGAFGFFLFCREGQEGYLLVLFIFAIFAWDSSPMLLSSVYAAYCYVARYEAFV